MAGGGRQRTSWRVAEGKIHDDRFAKRPGVQRVRWLGVERRSCGICGGDPRPQFAPSVRQLRRREDLHAARLVPPSFNEPVARADRQVRKLVRPCNDFFGRGEEWVGEGVVRPDLLAPHRPERLENILRDGLRLALRHPEEELPPGVPDDVLAEGRRLKERERLRRDGDKDAVLPRRDEEVLEAAPGTCEVVRFVEEDRTRRARPRRTDRKSK